MLYWDATIVTELFAADVIRANMRFTKRSIFQPQLLEEELQCFRQQYPALNIELLRNLLVGGSHG